VCFRANKRQINGKTAFYFFKEKEKSHYKQPKNGFVMRFLAWS
jgi:hypothetical protein